MKANILSKPLELTNEQESILERNLVWIFASPRSGTSWLALRLLTHSTLTMDEPYIGDILAIVTGKIGVNAKLYQRLKKRKDYFFSDEYSDLWKHHLRKMILNRIYGQFQNLSMKIIIKEPNGSFGSKIISECLPNSKIINLLRDGRDILDSFLDAHSEGGWIATRDGKVVTSDERIPFLSRLARNWDSRMKCVIETYQNHHRDLRYTVKYENLLKNTTEELEKIYKFLDIEIGKKQLEKIVTNSSFVNIPPERKGKGKSQRSATPGAWKKSFSEEEKKVIEEIIKERLLELSYEV